MNTPTQVLHDINTTLIENIELIKQPTVGRFITKEEFASIKKTLMVYKEVWVGAARISLWWEGLESKNFHTCIPIIIQDQLNEYALLGHFFTWEAFYNSAQNITGSLHWLPQGSLVVKLPYSNNSYDIWHVENFLKQQRNDIIDIEKVPIPDIGSYFDVVYSSQTKKAYIQSLSYGDKVYEISWFDFGLTEKLPPQYFYMRQYFAMDIGNTFFL